MVWQLKLQLLVSLFFLFLSFNTSAKVVFQKQKLQINKKVITVEIAKSAKQLKKGLMNRKNLAKDSGMLFVYNKEMVLRFWMKNTLIPLSIAYINKDKKIVDIQKMYPEKKAKSEISYKRYVSKQPSQFALEMNLGWFSRNKIKIGDKIQFIQPVP